MVSSVAVLSIALIAVGLVLTPGPNTVYLVSRTVAQGRTAGLVALLGVGAGFVIYLAGSAAGVTAVLTLVPHLFDAIRFVGAAYLLWLAWHTVRAQSIVDDSELTTHSHGRLFLVGLATNLLNPTMAVLYLSLLPRFIDSARGNVAVQGLILGSVQIAIMLAFNCLVVLAAGRITPWLTNRPRWLRVQRWLAATVLASLAVQIAVTQ
ncbi:LysE family translocator [Allorhizocola rhizosphaerae]|uniref:LysE family translocator n=1 Tax=Allorhizocola rhizosphaerae TaxID=1872709 RepID=UPI000E3BBAB2|nr:LysE family translocator [Allorhizocola rhizosphaerae]